MSINNKEITEDLLADLGGEKEGSESPRDDFSPAISKLKKELQRLIFLKSEYDRRVEEEREYSDKWKTLLIKKQKSLLSLFTLYNIAQDEKHALIKEFDRLKTLQEVDKSYFVIEASFARHTAPKVDASEKEHEEELTPEQVELIELAVKNHIHPYGEPKKAPHHERIQLEEQDEKTYWNLKNDDRRPIDIIVERMSYYATRLKEESKGVYSGGHYYTNEENENIVYFKVTNRQTPSLSIDLLSFTFTNDPYRIEVTLDPHNKIRSKSLSTKSYALNEIIEELISDNIVGELLQSITI